MFGFNKKKKEEKNLRGKKQSSIDKIIMGAVIGGAIGSVIGVGMAPQKGAETRKQVVKKTGKVFGKIQGKIGEFVKGKKGGLPQSPREKNIEFRDAKKIPHEN